jgi:hypothetical protein
MPTRSANIDLQIEELILHDLPYDQRHRVAAAIEQALTRLLAESGAPDGWAGREPVTPGPITVNPRLSAEVIGMQVANSIYGQLAAGVSVQAASMPQVKG